MNHYNIHYTIPTYKIVDSNPEIIEAQNMNQIIIGYLRLEPVITVMATRAYFA